MTAIQVKLQLRYQTNHYSNIERKKNIMTKTITFNNGEYFSDVLLVVFERAIQKGIINKAMSELLLEQELSSDLFADANVNLTSFGHEFFKLAGVELQVKINEFNEFDYTLTFTE